MSRKRTKRENGAVGKTSVYIKCTYIIRVLSRKCGWPGQKSTDHTKNLQTRPRLNVYEANLMDHFVNK